MKDFLMLSGYFATSGASATETDIDHTAFGQSINTDQQSQLNSAPVFTLITKRFPTSLPALFALRERARYLYIPVAYY